MISMLSLLPIEKPMNSLAVVVAVILTILAKLAIICYFCARRSMIRNAVVTDIQAVVANSGPVAARPTPACNVVPVWKVGAPTVEKFLQEVAKDNPIRFSAQQLCVFTNNYTKRLGSGGFGVVYEGKFPNGVKIAVKVLNRRSDGRAEEQFMAEVLTIGRTHHVNLVRLYGFCHDQYMSALVYEFLEKGSLDRYLFSETEAIGWNKLHEIAIGTAKGVAYLHEECHQRIIDYDIKPANILLDANFFPKVADFGLAKLCNRAELSNRRSNTMAGPFFNNSGFVGNQTNTVGNNNWINASSINARNNPSWNTFNNHGKANVGNLSLGNYNQNTNYQGGYVGMY